MTAPAQGSRIGHFLGAVLLLSCGGPRTHAQEAAPGPERVTVAVTTIPPFVMECDGALSGFEIELWRLVAEDLDLEFEFLPVQPFETLLGDLEKGRADVALGAITIQADREAKYDFSHQYFPSGLQILVAYSTQSVLGSILRNVFSARMLRLLGVALMFVLLCGLLCWWSERGRKGAFNPRFLPGCFEALYWTVVTMSTVGYGDFSPKRPLGRSVAVFVIIAGIGLYGAVVAKAASALAVYHQQHEINCPEDLGGRKVATVLGTTSEEPLRYHGATIVGAERIERAYDLLLEGEVEAVVFDAPTLQHYAHGAGAGRVMAVGEVFRRQYYGIAFRQGSPLRERVNCALLELRTNGVYDRLHATYFGGG